MARASAWGSARSSRNSSVSPFEKTQVILGNSDELIAGGGSGGSRSTQASGSALLAASDEVVKKGKQAAAHILEAAVADIEFEAGAFHIAGTDRSIDLIDLAARLRRRIRCPKTCRRISTPPLIHDDPPSGYPNGSHVVEVEIDPETGVVTVDRYTAVNDFGTIINPLLVAGQAQGGIVQGLGQVLCENVVYDRGRPASYRLLHGLRHAARGRCAVHRL